MLVTFNATKQITDPFKKAVRKISNHPSILKINGHYHNAGPFAFQKVDSDTIDKGDRNVNPKITTTDKNIPPKTLKSISDVCVEHLTPIFNDCIANLTFPVEPTYADVTSLPKN